MPDDQSKTTGQLRVVVVPGLDDREDGITLGFSRPGNVRITRVDTLATAPLPPVPEAAL